MISWSVKLACEIQTNPSVKVFINCKATIDSSTPTLPWSFLVNFFLEIITYPCLYSFQLGSCSIKFVGKFTCCFCLQDKKKCTVFRFHNTIQITLISVVLAHYYLLLISAGLYNVHNLPQKLVSRIKWECLQVYLPFTNEV